jgi:UDP-N-acetyl-D-glucosamine/UDP-N-acetyl-D-galactosamine dehydrogenase
VKVQVCDPRADPDEAIDEYGVTLVPLAEAQMTDVVVAAVPHEEYRRLTVAQLRKMMNGLPLLADLKGIFDRQAVLDAGIMLWRL